MISCLPFGRRPVIGSALAERVGQEEVGGCHPQDVGSIVYRRSLWLALYGPFLSFLALMELGNSPLTLQGLHYQ